VTMPFDPRSFPNFSMRRLLFCRTCIQSDVETNHSKMLHRAIFGRHLTIRQS
jgi:hypothetical protein